MSTTFSRIWYDNMINQGSSKHRQDVRDVRGGHSRVHSD